MHGCSRIGYYVKIIPIYSVKSLQRVINACQNKGRQNYTNALTKKPKTHEITQVKQIHYKKKSFLRNNKFDQKCQGKKKIKKVSQIIEKILYNVYGL